MNTGGCLMQHHTIAKKLVKELSAILLCCTKQTSIQTSTIWVFFIVWNFRDNGYCSCTYAALCTPAINLWRKLVNEMTQKVIF